MKFKDFNLDHNIQKGIELAGYETPTPIQLQAIPAIMAGKDVMGLAQTGTGKTAAFLLPILNHIMKKQGEYTGVKALIIAPTRELADQINQSIVTLAKFCGIRSIVIFGGVNFSYQIKNLKRQIDIIVACPGRLLDHIKQNTIDLSSIEILVLDEVDQMFDIGFLPDVKRIVKAVPAQRQTVMFSATMPEDIKRLAHDILSNPSVIEVHRTTPAPVISQSLYPVTHQLKTVLLLEILKKMGNSGILIFARTKSRVKMVARELEKHNFKVTSLQGDLSQGRRKSALDGLKKGVYQIMVATDIAARGIDVSLISHVVNFDIPDTAEAYVHRIGRTGRANRTGDAYTLITREDENKVRQIERLTQKTIERRIVEGFDYNQAPPKREFIDFSDDRNSNRPRSRSYSNGSSGGSRFSNHRSSGDRNKRSSNHSRSFSRREK